MPDSRKTKDPRVGKDAKAQEAANMNVLDRATGNKRALESANYTYHKTSQGGVWKKSGKPDVINIGAFSMPGF